jgi:hypothetical protein
MITFAATMARQPILLALGQMTINDSVTIRGLGAAQTTVNGQNATRLFDITEVAGDVTFDGLKLTGGKTTVDFQPGGAIRARFAGELTIQNSVISGNATTGFNSGGGGIFAYGVTVTSSTIAGNSTAEDGAAGGGIFSYGPVAVTSSTISGNATEGAAAAGGGIWANAPVTVTNSTISGNFTLGQFANGGGIRNYGELSVSSSTITGNSVAGASASGGGLISEEGPLTIRNSIVAGNRDLQDGSHPDLRQVSGSPIVQFSLIGDNNGTALTPAAVGSPDANGNLIGTHAAPIDPRLGPLANNGGLLQTHALCTGVSTPHASCTSASPAFNAGSNALIPADTFDLDGDGDFGEPIPFDQRGLGFARVFNTIVDMGSFELQPTHPWHNDINPLDVVGSESLTPDGHIVAGDALAIINYINAFGSGAVPAGAAIGQPYGFLDTTGGVNGTGDDFIAPDDALAVINAINAGLGGEGEASAERGVRNAECEAGTGGEANAEPTRHAGTPTWSAEWEAEAEAEVIGIEELITMLAVEGTQYAGRRRGL